MTRRLCQLVLTVSPLIVSAPCTLSAQTDTIGIGAAVSRARQALRGLRPLWHTDTATIDWLLVSKSVVLRTRGARPLERVSLPAGAPRANMSYTMGGERLAMIVLPLGTDTDANARLLVHEAMHTLQPRVLPNPGNTEPMSGGDFLDRADGRTWLFLELRALARALTSQGLKRTAAAHDALAYRAHRDELATAAERARLDALDLAEGIPEYSGWRLVNTSAAQLAGELASARHRNVSWVRAVGYSTGPAYGYLLDALGSADWHERWQRGARLPDLLREAVGLDKSAATVAERATHDDDGSAIITAEQARDSQRARTLDSLRAKYVQPAVLRVIPAMMQVTFDPNGQMPLDNEGTVMRNFRWASADGAELSAPDGALVNPTWSHVQVPLGDASLAEGALTDPITVSGNGWKLTLPRGWVVKRIGLVTEVRPPAK